MTIIQIYPGKVWGGAEQLVHDLSGALTARGHKVLKLAPEGSAAAETDPDATPLDFRGRSLGLHARTTANIIRDTGADILHIHDISYAPLAVRAAKLSGRSSVKIILTHHIARAKGVPRHLRPALKKLHRIVFVSEFARRRFAAANKWLSPDIQSVVLNSVSLSNPPDEVPPSKTSAPEILFCGRVRKSKGVTTLIRACGLLKDLDWQLKIVGKPRSERYLQKCIALCNALDIAHRVEFTGHTSAPGRYIRSCAIGVAPSIVREACGLSPMEFMAAGKPVITTDNGAQPEYISNGITGILIPSADSEALANALRRLLTDPDARSLIGNRARQYFNSHLSYPEFVSRVEAVYTSC